MPILPSIPVFDVARSCTHFQNLPKTIIIIHDSFDLTYYLVISLPYIIVIAQPFILNDCNNVSVTKRGIFHFRCREVSSTFLTVY